MKGANLGEFEELLLLVIAGLSEGEAYSIAIGDRLREKTNRSAAGPVIHATLARLEEKGYVKSDLGGATAERGGRRKRFYSLTYAGYQALEMAKGQRDALWQLIPNKSWK